MVATYTPYTWVAGASACDETNMNHLEEQAAGAVTDAGLAADAKIVAHDVATAHGVTTVADVTDIATDGNLSAAAQAAIAASHARSHAMDGASDHSAGTPGDILIAGAAGAWTRLAKGSAYQRLVMDAAADYPAWQDEIMQLGGQIGDGVNVITTGIKLRIPLFVGCTITEWSLGANESGSIQLDLWVDSEANYPPTIADTIVASDHPKITTATNAHGTALTGWTKAFATGTKRYIYVNVDSCTTIKQVTFTLTCKKGL